MTVVRILSTNADTVRATAQRLYFMQHGVRAIDFKTRHDNESRFIVRAFCIVSNGKRSHIWSEFDELQEFLTL